MITITDLCKTPEPNQDEVLEPSRSGMEKHGVESRTGPTVGVEDASFTIEGGEIIVTVSLSCSGKSTLIRMLNRLREPTSGRVEIEGEDVTSMSHRQLIQLRQRRQSDLVTINPREARAQRRPSAAA